MYLILEGPAYVVVESGGDELVLDELGPGEVFGEIALLTGARRTASIRAAGALVLLQINRAPFAKLLAARPDLRRALYLAYAQRIFRNYLPSLSPFAHVRADACHRWLAAATHHDLVPRAPVETARDSYVFVLQGPVEIQGDDEWLAVQGPALVHVGYHARLHTPTGAVAFELPPPPDDIRPEGGAPPFFARAHA